MPTTYPGRMTHRYDGELVVFLIGMTINRWWRIDQWWPVFQVMPGLLAELSKDPGSGLLGHRLTLGSRGPLVVQYWSSLEKLYGYAGDRDALHRPAWAEFNRRARRNPEAVGIWHETFQVSRAESIYVGTPAMGLAQSTELVPIPPRRDRAVARMVAGGTGPSAG
jgi:hypothetical protein